MHQQVGGDSFLIQGLCSTEEDNDARKVVKDFGAVVVNCISPKQEQRTYCMTQFSLQKKLRFISRPTLIAGAALLLEWPLCGCVLVGGYKSGTGFFIWPGSLAVVVVVFLLMFGLRRR